MEYSYKFISLVSKVCSSNDHNLQFIGQGNPHAQILLVGKDCNVDLSTTRGKGCYEMEYLHSAAKWKRNVDSGTEPSEVIDWGIQEQLKRISYSLVMLMIAFLVGNCLKINDLSCILLYRVMNLNRFTFFVQKCEKILSWISWDVMRNCSRV